MKKYLLLFVLSFLLLSPALVFAQNNNSQSGTIQANTQSGSISCPTGSVCLANPLGNVSTPQALIGKIINSILGIVGSIALLMFVYGGLTWMTSSGSQEKVKKGRDIIVWSGIGLVVIFMAYALTRVVLSTIAQ